MSCKRTDCLYHPDHHFGYNCDYMLLTGEKRNSPPGRKCDKYKYATPQEQTAVRRNQTDIVIRGVDEGEYDNGLL